MTTALGESVELLERSLGYARGRLVLVDDPLLDRRTPCAAWSLGDLLCHMEDSLDAFTEAAGGSVGIRPRRSVEGRVAAIQQKACALLGVWARPAPGDVLVGGLDLASPLLVATAALEITVHGWDVGQATGERAPLPEELAAELDAVARLTVTDRDRGVRFGRAVDVAVDAPAGVRLLGLLGRRN